MLSKDTRLFCVVVDAWDTGMSVAITGHNDRVAVDRILQYLTENPGKSLYIKSLLNMLLQINTSSILLFTSYDGII